MHRLRPIVTLMHNEVVRFGGLVLSVVGDGIFAVFGGAPSRGGTRAYGV